MAKRRKYLKWLRRIGIVIVVIVVVVGIAEWMFRGLQDKILDPKDSTFVFDPSLGHIFKPFLATETRNPITGERVVIDINSAGLRDKEVGSKRKDEVRIVGLGDSFTAATHVGLGDTYLKQSEKISANIIEEGGGYDRTYRFLNAAIDGYNLDQERKLLMKLGKTLDPDVVLVGLYVGDDIRDYDRPAGLGLPAKQFFRDRSYVYHLLHRGYHAVRRIGKGKEREGAAADAYAEAARREIPVYRRDDSLGDAWAATENALRAIRDASQDLGAKTVLVLLPSKRQVVPSEWQSTLDALGVRPEEYDLERPQKKLASVASDLGIPVLDLLPAFRGHPSPDSLYFSGTQCWTPVGHALAAEAISKTLLREGLVK